MLLANKTVATYINKIMRLILFIEFMINLI